jgi:hypothetical protein
VLVLRGDRGGRIADIEHTCLSVAAGIPVVIAAIRRLFVRLATNPQ